MLIIEATIFEWLKCARYRANPRLCFISQNPYKNPLRQAPSGETEVERDEITTQGAQLVSNEGDLNSVLPDSEEHALTTTQRHLSGTT